MRVKDLNGLHISTISKSHYDRPPPPPSAGCCGLQRGEIALRGKRIFIVFLRRRTVDALGTCSVFKISPMMGWCLGWEG